MSIVINSNKKCEPLVGMGEIVLVRRGELARAVLGSCIGLVLFHARAGVASLAHVVLPASEGRDGPPGKFADTAVPHMLDLLLAAGAPRTGLIAKFTGGANMFGGKGPIQIGKANAAAIEKSLQMLGIRAAGNHVGGSKGRKIAFCPTEGKLTVEVVGEAPAIL
jgi:chemotaxis protein CheD